MKKRLLLIILLGLLVAGFLLPEQRVIPVSGATLKDWNAQSFWYYPWGRSGTHKGIDIFAARHAPVVATSSGLVLIAGNNGLGGKSVFILSAKWRVHYYAHLQQIDASALQWVQAGEQLGTVGDSGNARGKPPHLHYVIRSLIPLLRNADPTLPQGWRKMFYINPHEFLLWKSASMFGGETSPQYSGGRYG